MLIAIEGVDKSGKETQTDLLIKRLLRENRGAKKIEFPNYSSEAAGALRMYLNGDFGKKPDDVNPYAASVLFAVDRYASYKTDWGAFHEAGGVVVADRYTMSNMIHQGAKIIDPAERRRFFDWIVDLEFIKIGLPRPDIVIFLDLPMDIRMDLMKKKAENAPPDARREPDIHENDAGYLNRSSACAREAADLLGWIRIDAGRGGAMRPASDIHEEVYTAIARMI